MALAVVIFYYAASSEVAWLFLLAYWVAALVVASFVYALWNRGVRGELAVSGTFSAPGSPLEELPEHLLKAGPAPAPIFEGDRMELAVRLATGGGARGPARLVGDVADSDIVAGAGLVPGTGWTEHRTIGPLRRGPVGPARWVVESGDLLGLFRRREQTTRADVALVLPRFGTLGGRVHTRELEASVAAPRSGSGTELFGIREYRAGDALRRIHWRSSARHGELIVREYEPPGVQTLGILCDPHPPSREAADQVARIAASEAWDSLRAGARVFLWAPGCEPTRPDESRSLWALLEWLARYPAPGELSEDGPPAMTDVVVVTASNDPDLVEALEDVGARGGDARAWVVGDAMIETDAPLQRAGLGWPL